MVSEVVVVGITMSTESSHLYKNLYHRLLDTITLILVYTYMIISFIPFLWVQYIICIILYVSDNFLYSRFMEPVLQVGSKIAPSLWNILILEMFFADKYIWNRVDDRW